MAIGDWDQRILCSDGGCVGVIGPDGTCKVCGRVAPNWGDERKRGLLASEPDEDAENAEDEGAEELAPSPPDRELCSDGGCIGVIGEDGRCKVCGRPGSTPRAGASERATQTEPETDTETETETDTETDTEAPDRSPAAPGAQATEDDLADRALCPDGACIGVIGPDGTCKVCGTEGA